jgi:hypothetical protein
LAFPQWWHANCLSLIVLAVCFQLFAQVQIMKEDTLMRIPRDAFGSLACVPKCKSGKANQAVTSSSEAEYWTDDNSEAGSNNDFLEDAESTEDERM